MPRTHVGEGSVGILQKHNQSNVSLKSPPAACHWVCCPLLSLPRHQRMLLNTCYVHQVLISVLLSNVFLITKVECNIYLWVTVKAGHVNYRHSLFLLFEGQFRFIFSDIFFPQIFPIGTVYTHHVSHIAPYLHFDEFASF